MDSSTQTSVLAIDGGGTRCRVALEDGGGVVSVETGPANVSTDFDGAVAQIIDGIDTLSRRAGLDAGRLRSLPAFVGLAGVIGDEIPRRLRAALPFERLRIEDDRPAAIRGALGPGDGVVAHCGTGSFFGTQRNGAMTLAGGWGPILGDEASACWIGRTALALTLRAVDGRLDGAPLADELLDDLGGPAGIVRFAASARPPDFGALAPRVTERARSGDALARHVMERGAEEIARSIARLGWTPGTALCLTGGVGPQYAPYLSDTIRADIVEPAGEPLSGALSLARDLAREAVRERG